MKLLLTTVMMLLALQSAAAGDLYRWVDQSGKVHYGDVPANDAQQLQERKFDRPATPLSEDEALPYEVRRAKQRFPVTLYVTENCAEACQQARDFLTQQHIPFAEKKLLTQDEFNAFKQQSGSDAVPALSVGSNWLKGFLASEWRAQLDAAGYPK